MGLYGDNSDFKTLVGLTITAMTFDAEGLTLETSGGRYFLRPEGD